jgi:uncharacterized protein DUF7002
MAFDIAEFVRLRPFLYHLTAARNLTHIRASRVISPAAELMKSAGRLDLMRQKRIGHVPIDVNGRPIVLRDQVPLHRGNMKLPEGFTFEDFVESLNSRIFFWPGRASGPISYGTRHFERYRSEHPVILRARVRSLLASNPGLEPHFCQYNSGSPRCSYGEKSPRGRNTFLSHSKFPGSPSKVVEVTFTTEIILPRDAEYGLHPGGPWQQVG